MGYNKVYLIISALWLPGTVLTSLHPLADGNFEAT